MKIENLALKDQIQQLQAQLKGASEENHHLTTATQRERKTEHKKWHTQNKYIFAAREKLTHLRTAVGYIRRDAENLIQGNLTEIERYRAKFANLKVLYTHK